MSIGIGITTRNRPVQLAATLAHIIDFTSDVPDLKLVVVDDASDQPIEPDIDSVEVHRFERQVGIARAKNKCLELLADRDHIFLFDDDAYPIREGWWRPYVDSPEPHLMYQFLDLAGERKLRDVTELYRDDHHFALSGPRGVMLYVQRHVLDVVGGLDPVFSPWGYEHGDWSNRIHHAGLTTWRYADVVGSDQLIHSMDEHEEVDRGTTTTERQALVRRNARIHNARRESGYIARIPYVEPTGRNVIITSLFSGTDPQRPTAEPLDDSSAETLFASIPRDQELIYITDIPGTEGAPGITPRLGRRVHHELHVNVYFERWIASWRYLRDNPDIGYACLVDATDVEMLASPWERMLPGRLYIGHEPTTVSCRWMRTHHPAATIQRFIRDHQQHTLVNPGVLGGDRDTVMAFLHAVIQVFFDLTTRAHRGEGDVGVGDMGVVNLVAHTLFADVIEFGPWWVTPFKSYAYDDTVAAWRHK